MKTPPRELPETIKHAAVKSKCGFIIMGKCHGDCFGKGYYTGLKMESHKDDQGFMTSHGRYVDREEAGKIAFESNQIDKLTTCLYSEDLWSEHSGGKFIYDEIEGYVIEKVRE